MAANVATYMAVVILAASALLFIFFVTEAVRRWLRVRAWRKRFRRW